MVGALQTFFFSHVKKVWFYDIIDEGLNYDEFEVDSDNDTIDALGIAIMQLLNQDQVAVNDEELMKNNPYDYPEWGENSDGNLVDKTVVAQMRKDDPLGKYEDYFSRYSRTLKSQDDDEKEDKSDPYWT